jgi:prephenate dehydratase
MDTAKIYDLHILKKSIEDNKNNFTRFVVIGTSANKAGNKASVVFSVKHIPGSLFHALRSYSALELNLTKIESRPLFGKTWEYIFFADFEIENKNEKFKEMIREMKETTEFINILGIYNKGDTHET